MAQDFAGRLSVAPIGTLRYRKSPAWCGSDKLGKYLSVVFSPGWGLGSERPNVAIAEIGSGNEIATNAHAEREIATLCGQGFAESIDSVANLGAYLVLGDGVKSGIAGRDCLGYGFIFCLHLIGCLVVC